MAKVQTLKGFRDFLPADMIVRNEAILRLRKVFEKYGFEELQTPSLETQQILLGKYGEEAERLMYLFEDTGKRKVGLKYDLTVPLARAVAANSTLPMPFKRYQIQPVWRAENTQKGRYREFYQCDIDIVGSASPISDAEILAVLSDGLIALGFEKFKIRINSRVVLFDAMKEAGFPENKWATVIQSVDKLDKKSKDEVVKELTKKGFESEKIKKVFDAIESAKPDKFLQKTMDYARKFGVKNLEFDPTLARGLDYYTGPIFETIVEAPRIGSITGGGRYDKLLKTLGGPDLPAVGSTIGLERVVDVIEELKMWPDLPKSTTTCLVTIFSDDLEQISIETASFLRAEGINTDIYPLAGTKLDKQFKFADKKGIPWVIVIGPTEQTQEKVVLKNMNTRSQETLNLKSAIKVIHES